MRCAEVMLSGSHWHPEGPGYSLNARAVISAWLELRSDPLWPSAHTPKLKFNSGTAT